MTEYVGEGKITGYIDEVDAVLGQIERVCRMVKERRPDSKVRLVRGEQMVLGTRGWFNKRVVVKTSYSLYVDDQAQYETFKAVFRVRRDRKISAADCP